MKTSMGLLVRTPETILQDHAVNAEVNKAFDQLDRQNNSTAKTCKCILKDETPNSWKIDVIFDWKVNPTSPTGNPRPGDLVVKVLWTMKNKKLGYEILDYAIYDSED